jgi:hypothetical protein
MSWSSISLVLYEGQVLGGYVDFIALPMALVEGSEPFEVRRKLCRRCTWLFLYLTCALFGNG